MNSIRWLWLELVLLIGAAGSGCSSASFQVLYYPSFDISWIEDVGVEPFSGYGGDHLKPYVVSSLRSNGAYSVVDRTNSFSESAAGVDVVLNGHVYEYSVTREIEEWSTEECYTVEVENSRHRHGHRHDREPETEEVCETHWHERIWDHAEAGATVELTNAHTGERFYSRDISKQFSSYTLSQSDTLDRAVYDLAEAIVYQIAPTWYGVKLKGKDFRTASALIDKEWVWADKFQSTDETAFVVLRVPKQADRNTFTVQFYQKDHSEVLFSKDYVWEGAYSSYGFNFSPKELYEMAGAGKYRVVLVYRQQKLLETTFKIH